MSAMPPSVTSNGRSSRHVISRAAAPEASPLFVLCRHGGPGDSFAIANWCHSELVGVLREEDRIAPTYLRRDEVGANSSPPVFRGLRSPLDSDNPLALPLT
jgi:hypothetical protein